MRLDADLLAWFRQQRGYQTRINAILRRVYEERGFRRIDLDARVSRTLSHKS